MSKRDGDSVPRAMQPVYEAVSRLTDAFCAEHLTEEYGQGGRELAAALARKRPAPLARGRGETWACAIVYTIGSVNFLFDRIQTPHMRADHLCELFGVSQSTASAKSTRIRDTRGMIQLDPRWCLTSTLADNPLAWMLSVNGLIVDARYAPREVQGEALRLRLIPYLPATSRGESS